MQSGNNNKEKIKRSQDYVNYGIPLGEAINALLKFRTRVGKRQKSY